jgi:hypothetical protein
MRIRTLGAIAGICLVPPNPGPLKKEFKKGTDILGIQKLLATHLLGGSNAPIFAGGFLVFGRKRKLIRKPHLRFQSSMGGLPGRDEAGRACGVSTAGRRCITAKC